VLRAVAAAVAAAGATPFGEGLSRTIRLIRLLFH
jgi:hypothetical protein